MREKIIEWKYEMLEIWACHPYAISGILIGEASLVIFLIWALC